MLILVAILSLLVAALVAVTWACWRRETGGGVFSARRLLKRAIPPGAEPYLVAERFLFYGIVRFVAATYSRAVSVEGGVSWRTGPDMQALFTPHPSQVTIRAAPRRPTGDVLSGAGRLCLTNCE